MPVAGRPLVEWSIEAFRAVTGVRSIVVACPPGHAPDLGGDDVRVVEGGATRSHSVANALEAVGTELVAIHDAARPLVTAELIEGVVATLAANPEADGAIAATPVANTVKRAGPSSSAPPAPGRTRNFCQVLMPIGSSTGQKSSKLSIARPFGRRRRRRCFARTRCAAPWRPTRMTPRRRPTRRCWSRLAADEC